jgi:signal transduction histidine kinase
MMMFSFYWGLYILAITIYYWDIDMKQMMLYAVLFYLVYEIFKQNYELTNSVIEVSYDLHEDPVIIYENNQNIKVNRRFREIFESVGDFKFINHYTQMLYYIAKPGEIIYTFVNNSIKTEVTLEEIIKNNQQYNGEAFAISLNGEERMFTFNSFDLVNIYSRKTICMFKETTMVYKLEREISSNKYKSVLMGCLTHELRTPVNCVISGLDLLEPYIVSHLYYIF